nr:hypothetical protein [Tanacetum cinerariifolium]
MNYPRFTKVIIDYFMTRKPSISRRNRINWHYDRDDALFSTIKVVSRHQTTQQYSAILPIELTTAEIRNSKAYKEYHACVMGEAAPKPKVSARKKNGDSASSTTLLTPTPTTTVESAPRLFQRTEAEQLKIVLKRSRQETHISQQSGSGTDEGTGSKPGVPDVPSDDSEEELSWKSFDDEEVGGHEEGNKSDESDDDRDEGSDDDSEETVKAGAVFSRSNCTEDCKVKFATGTLTEEALFWWNSFPQPIAIEESYKITWSEFKKLLIEKYCPRTEVLVVLCPTVVPNSKKLMEVFIEGLSRSIEGNVTTSKPQNLEEAITITQRLMDQKRRQEIVKAYDATPTENKGSSDQNCKNMGPTTGSNLQPVSVTCHACGEKGHYRNQYPKANNNAHGRAYLLREKNARQDPNVVT